MFSLLCRGPITVSPFYQAQSVLLARSLPLLPNQLGGWPLDPSLLFPWTSQALRPRARSTPLPGPPLLVPRCLKCPLPTSTGCICRTRHPSLPSQRPALQIVPRAAQRRTFFHHGPQQLSDRTPPWLSNPRWAKGGVKNLPS